jgi:hypothetical protein
MVRVSDRTTSARRRRLTGLVVTALLFAGISCSGIPTAEVPTGSSGSSGSTSGSVTLTVVNGTSDTVCFMRISPATSSGWGEDQLGSNTISAGASHSFTVPAGTYDLQAEFCGGGETTSMGVSLSSNYTWNLSGAQPVTGNVTLHVVNNSTNSVCFMRISPVTSSDWGQDWLGSNTISSGSSHDFSIAAGSYDLRAEFCGGGEATSMGVSITGNYTWTLQ